MTVRVLVVCDRCGNEREVEGSVGCFHRHGVHFNLCPSCEKRYRELLDKEMAESIRLLREFLSNKA